MLPLEKNRSPRPPGGAARALCFEPPQFVHPADERSPLIGAEVVDDGGVSQYVSLQANSPRRRRRGPWGVRDRPVRAFLDASGLNSPSRLLPIIAWLPAYTRAKLTGDIVAGLTVGLMVLPQALADASIAGLPPEFGLYASFMGAAVYGLTGSSRDVAVGPTALMALVVGEAFPELPGPAGNTTWECADPARDLAECCTSGGELLCTSVPKVIASSLVAGAFLTVLGMLNLGVVVNFIGLPVLSGFFTAAALSIMTTQFRHILGIVGVRRKWLYAITDIGSKIAETSWQDAVLGFAMMALAVLLRRLKARHELFRNDSWRRFTLWLLGTAGNAVVVIVGLVFVRILAAAAPAGETAAFKIVGPVPPGLPPLRNPMDGIDDWIEMISASGVIALLCYIEAIAVGKTFAQLNGYEIDPTQELRSIGLANVLGSFVGAYPVTGSLSRTAVNAASGAQTQAGNLVTALLVMFALGVLTSVLQFIPKAALAAIIIISVGAKIDLREVREIWRVSAADFVVWMTAFLLCLLWSLEYGLIAAVAVSFVVREVGTSTQPLWRLRKSGGGNWVVDANRTTDGHVTSWLPGFMHGTATEGHVVLRPAASVTFSMRSEFQLRTNAIARAIRSDKRLTAIVLDCSAVAAIDVSGATALRELLASTAPATAPEASPDQWFGSIVYVVNLPPKARAMLQDCRLFAPDPVFAGWPLRPSGSIDEALAQFDADCEDVMASFPFGWLVPTHERPFDHAPGHVANGIDGSPWVVAEHPGSGATGWVRSNRPSNRRTAQHLV